ncbi:lipid-A-disaccharide synthase [Casimicrobium huifangae]|uniref:lipid-A-disaccharide synthase n=1 Tax=Casimicrobium huifangae TaxID=2591109 RepID=UPI003784F351
MSDVVIVAGETSGDQLAADLVERVRRVDPSVRFHGIAGPRMRAAGVSTWIDSETLAVRGYAEVLAALPRILRAKRALLQHTLDKRPALYIGVDAPDFNLRVERELKAHGIRTLHFVCPSFWAWRPERAARFRDSADHVLCLFPFEPALLAQHQVPATFVGHPLATAPLRHADRERLRRKLEHHDAPAGAPLIAVLPGSRVDEIDRHAELFVAVMKRLSNRFVGARFVVPLVTRETRERFENVLWRDAEALVPQVQLLFGHADFALRAADVALVASGTATLEAAMLGVPQVVSYRVSALTAMIVRRKLKSPYVSLPNILANDWCVPELLQEAATEDALDSALSGLIAQPRLAGTMRDAYARMGDALRPPVSPDSDLLADAVLAEVRWSRR